MPYFQKGDVRIRYEETGSGFPLLVTPGGGLNSRVSNWPTAVINAMEAFKNDFRCITMDQRNANDGESTGPVPVDNPWDAFADDQLGLMDHLGIREFFYMGYCIGGCFAGKLLQRAPDRVLAAVFCQTVGHRPEDPTVMYRHSKDNWEPEFLTRRPDVSTETIEKYFHNLYAVQPDSCTACRATSSGTAIRPCSCCRMTYQGIRCKHRSMLPLWHPMPRSRSSHGRSRET
jgi:pimeloyl-ACP methyl ester carboxylesterase